MDLGDITGLIQDKNAASVRVPDLDWLIINPENVKNIPTPMNVQIIPQLQASWGNTDKPSATLINNTIKSEESPSKKFAAEDINGVVATAKKEMMRGLIGKDLAKHLSGMYPPELITAAKEELVKVASEQGLLGGVYVDVSPFSSCAEAARVLGPNKIRLAKFVVGNPHRHVCSSHADGYCRELRKKVVAAMDYTPEIINDYNDHLKVAGVLASDEKVSSKEELRTALIKYASETKVKDTHSEVPTERSMDVSAYEKSFEEQLLKEAMHSSIEQAKIRFEEVRPILAFLQNEMLKGKMGSDLKEVISKKISSDLLQKFEPEIRKVASLQGLLGNVYVDVSFYKNADEAIRAIKQASTSPMYVIQTVPSELDSTLEKVAAQTGCEILPRTGAINKKVASSYVDDLQYNSRISSDIAKVCRDKIEAGENVLGILREAFLSTLQHKKTSKEGGVKSEVYTGKMKKFADTSKLGEATTKAVEAGLSIKSIEEKLASHISIGEASGMVRNIIASMTEIDANVLDECPSRTYQLRKDALIKKASKCNGCIMCSNVGCMRQGARFAAENSDQVYIDPKTQKVMLRENPDVSRQDR